MIFPMGKEGPRGLFSSASLRSRKMMLKDREPDREDIQGEFVGAVAWYTESFSLDEGIEKWLKDQSSDEWVSGFEFRDFTVDQWDVVTFIYHTDWQELLQMFLLVYEYVEVMRHKHG